MNKENNCVELLQVGKASRISCLDFSSDLIEYCCISKRYNDILTNYTRNIMANIPSDLLNIPWCIMTTGSDARCEKMNDLFSPIELIVFSSSRWHANEIAKFILSTIDKTIVSSHIECQGMDDSSRVLYSNDTYFPTRALEAAFIAGDYSIFLNYKEVSVNSIKNIDSKVQCFFEKNVWRDSLKQIRLAVEGSSRHCNISNGMIYIDNKRIKGTKYSHLRAVQYSIDLLIIQSIRMGLLELQDVLLMPLPIADRIQWLCQHSLASVLELDDSILQMEEEIVKSYRFCVYLHQVAQAKLETFLMDHAPALIDFELNEDQKKELQNSTDVIYRFVSALTLIIQKRKA